MDEFKRLEYFKSIRSEITIECFKNTGIGYLTLCIDEDLNLVENSMRFIEGPIDPEKFAEYMAPYQPRATPGKKQSGFYIYYSIIWYNKDGATATLWNQKEFIPFESGAVFWE